MRKIDLETWPRREHFKVYSTFDHPHFSMCANVDLTAFYLFVKQRDISFNLAFVYTLTRAANAIPEFRHRIREGNVIEHEIVHPATTIPMDEDLFKFCVLDYIENFPSFAADAAEKISSAQKDPSLQFWAGRDDVLVMTANPWVAFTNFTGPIPSHPGHSNPAFAWGKLFEDGKSLKIPLSTRVHHGLMDGLHVGRFHKELGDYFDQPEALLTIE